MASLSLAVLLLVAVMLLAGQGDAVTGKKKKLRGRVGSLERGLTALRKMHNTEVQDLQERFQGLNAGFMQHMDDYAAGPCKGGYTELRDNWRWMNNTDQHELMCDRNTFTPGWHRFFLHDYDAVIPTEPVFEKRCQTHAPLWLFMGDARVPGTYEDVRVKACAVWNNSTCLWGLDVTVRNCGHFLIYDLPRVSICNLAFCVMPATSSLGAK